MTEARTSSTTATAGLRTPMETQSTTLGCPWTGPPQPPAAAASLSPLSSRAWSAASASLAPSTPAPRSCPLRRVPSRRLALLPNRSKGSQIAVVVRNNTNFPFPDVGGEYDARACRRCLCLLDVTTTAPVAQVPQVTARSRRDVRVSLRHLWCLLRSQEEYLDLTWWCSGRRSTFATTAARGFRLGLHSNNHYRDGCTGIHICSASSA
ncbi:hypothetical protein C8F04DRAFT_176557 [Mycena alexandri]|uniref:Uncharacterized protein n=1 Tax=Mycena alexandri TaxID=1745969 RepID=A0AAD6WSN1_9AGAR|nr:hypothetical protein C8F04DRAFT_176557 [Mycena alexandri]